jgi:hypothetical protein
MYDMKTKAKIVQARIDEAAEHLLAKLRRRTGLTDSELVRKGLELMSQSPQLVTTRKIRGVGKFVSGRQDLGSNKSYLVGFGKS